LTTNGKLAPLFLYLFQSKLHRAYGIGLSYAHYRPPLVEVQSVLWLRPRTGDRVALLWEDKPSAVANNAHSRCRLSIAQASLALRSAQAFFDRLSQDEEEIQSYLGVWETLHNPNFNCVEFDAIKSASGTNRFILTSKEWIERTDAIGIISKAGRYGGTYAHKDIAYHFGMWLSPEFNLLVIKEFDRLKAEEQKQIGWSAKRELSKINYRIHTDAIKQNLIPEEVTQHQASIIYAEEADVLNVAMFGKTAKQWRDENPEQKGNIRDYASINELICLSNMENLNAVFIEQGIPQSERLVKLNQIAIQQMCVLENDGDRKLLK